MTAKLKFIGTAFTCLALSACGVGGSGGENHPDRTQTKIFLNGDPMDLLTDAELNQTSPFTSENISRYSDFTLTGSYAFIDKSKYTEAQKAKTSEELVRERT